MDSQPWKIVFYSRPTLFRNAVAGLLRRSPGVSEVIEIEDLEQALKMTLQDLPAIILVGDSPPEINAPAFAVRLARQGVKVPVLVLTGRVTHDSIVKCFSSGVAGYLDARQVDEQTLLVALEAVRSGLKVLGPQVLPDILPTGKEQASMMTEPAFEGLSPVAPGRALTGKEQVVLGHLVEGLSNREIAERLHVTVRTVEMHVERIMQKMGARSRTQAVVLALRERGLLRDAVGAG